MKKRVGKTSKHPLATGIIPSDTEELRQRFKVMGHHWELVRLSRPSKHLFVDFEHPTTWLNHVEWLLGEEIYGYTIESASDRPYSVAWKPFLELEFQVRKRAMEILTNDKAATLAAALASARKNDALMQKHFYIPLGIAAGKAAVVDAAAGSQRKRGTSTPRGKGQPPPAPHKVPRTDGKDKDGGKGGNGGGKGGKKGNDDKGNSWKKGATMFMPDGRKKCGYFQKPKGCSAGARCSFVHACTVCSVEGHGQFECPRRPKAENK